MRRQGYTELLDHIRSGGCEMLSMWEASRSARDMATWINLLDLCREHAVMIRLYGGDPETYDPRKQRDREHLIEQGKQAESEASRLSERVKPGTRRIARQGLPGGPLVFGYTRRYNEKTREFVSQDVDPDNAAIVRQLAADTLRGVSLNSQAMRLNDAGVPSPNSGRKPRKVAEDGTSRDGLWSGHGIARLLMNPAYIGKRTYHGEVVADGVWPAILTDDEHARLCTLLRAPGRHHFVDAKLRWMLSGAATCGVCGSVLRGQSGSDRTDKTRRYVCSNRKCFKVTAAIADMDPFVSQVICERLSRPDAMDVFAPPTDSLARRIAEGDLARLRAHLAEFVDQAARMKLSAASLAAVEERILPQIEAAERKLRRLSQPPILVDYADVDVPTVWDDLPPGVRREFVLALAEVRLSPVGKGGRWSRWRLAESRWRCERKTWGQHWRSSLHS
jgi:site-specific DNA recombinase